MKLAQSLSYFIKSVCTGSLQHLLRSTGGKKKTDVILAPLGPQAIVECPFIDHFCHLKVCGFLYVFNHSILKWNAPWISAIIAAVVLARVYLE